MSTAPLFPSFDGLISLSKHEGVDIRPTLLRVLTDLYVQAPRHNDDERRQFGELASRLIDAVDDATRAAVRARLTLCVDTPDVIADKLGLRAAPAPPKLPDLPPLPAGPAEDVAGAAAPAPAVAAAKPATPHLAIRPGDAAEIERMFRAATPIERFRILENLSESPLIAAVRPGPRRAARATETLEMAAVAGDLDSFAFELANVLLLPAKTAARIVDDPGGEPIACACKALGMPQEVFERVLLFLKPAVGASVIEVFRLARLYAVLGERSALIMVAVWRGATLAQAQARYQPALHDDERRRARPGVSSQVRPGAFRPSMPQPGRARSGS